MSKFSSPSIEAWNSYLGISDSTRGRPKSKNGEEAFEWVVLENLDEQCKSFTKEETLVLIEERENYWVEHHREREGVYNLREVSQSNLGIKYSEESKKKMGEWHCR